MNQATVVQCESSLNTIVSQFNALFENISELVDIYVDRQAHVINVAVLIKVQKTIL